MDHRDLVARTTLARMLGHQFAATRRVVDLLGHGRVEGAVADIAGVLLQADAFDARWVHVTLWEQDGEQVHAITRYWDDDSFAYRTEVSLADEGYGLYAVCLAQTILDGLSPQQLAQAALDPVCSLPTDPAVCVVIVRGPYRIVSIPAGVVLCGELSLGGGGDRGG